MDPSGEHFSLKWNDFRSSLTEGFHDFLQKEMMVDVTLAAEGKFLQAHKLVLSICSPYFKNLFTVNPCKHPIVILRDVSHRELSYMLEFMYKGEVGVKHEDLPSFIKLADTLNLKGLTGVKVQGGVVTYSSHTDSQIGNLRNKRTPCSDTEVDDTELDSDVCRLKELRPARYRKRKPPNALTKGTSKLSCTKKMKRSRAASSDRDSGDERDVSARNNTLDKFIVGKDKDGDDHSSNDESSTDMFDNGDLDEGGKTSPDECDLSTGLFDNSTDAEQVPQGGVDYQMIQTRRGKDMLLYDGYTFTQNRMCKDGMRWQCSYPKCKAFCRMSSAGWLTPHNSNHDHAKPSEDEIRKRILRMELKARAQSSGATPGEIIRNALPAEEYQTTDQRACYTRCIQRFRKSLQKKKNTKALKDRESRESSRGGASKKSSDDKAAGSGERESRSSADHLVGEVGLPENTIWVGTKDTAQVQESDDRRSVMEAAKTEFEVKMGPYRM